MKWNKEKILNVIENCKCWITIKKINEVLKDDMDKATIYRNLKRMSEAWEVIEEFKSTWEKIFKSSKSHHHHFECVKCFKKINIGCVLDEKLYTLSEENWFKITNHSFSIKGECNECFRKIMG